jgi:hypothetical protein
MHAYIHTLGEVVYDDLTQILLHQGYWASYNIPYFVDISFRSGYDDKAKTDDEFAYKKAPRAQLFADKVPIHARIHVHIHVHIHTHP